MIRFARSALLALAGFGFLSGCGDDTKTTILSAPDGSDQLVLTLARFPDPSPAHYALLADGTELLRFTVINGAATTLDGTPITSLDQAGSLAGVSSFRITVEDTLGVPSGPAIVAGSPSGTTAQLAVANASALGVDLSGAAGTALLDAPTTADPHDCQYGVWFTDGAGNSSLNLPTLPSSWRYEGWVIDRTTGATYSTGRFASPGAADDDGAGSTAGGEGTPYPFPGQDFAVADGSIPALDLDSGNFASALTIEPNPDSDPSPFPFKILEKNVVAGTVLFTFTQLPALTTLGSYEAWASYDDDSLLSIGKFRWSGSVMTDPETGRTITGLSAKCNLTDAARILISVEPYPDSDPGPSGSVLLAGDAANGSASLSTTHSFAWGTTVTPDTASYRFDSPSTTTDADFLRGLWFYSVPTPGDTVSTLGLASAPPGWTYQAWVQRTTESTPTSMGRFTDPMEADSDGAGPAAGTDTTAVLPRFPGQDFLNPITNITDGFHSVFLTLEPLSDFNDAGPFLSIYEDSKIITATQTELQAMPNLKASFPTCVSSFNAANTFDFTSLGGELPSATVTFAD